MKSTEQKMDKVISERDEIINVIWELYKDVNGIRPRFANFDEMSMERLNQWADSLTVELVTILEGEKIEQVENIKRFEARVASVIAMGSDDRETAIRWLMDAEDCERDKSYFKYAMGLPYDYVL